MTTLQWHFDPAASGPRRRAFALTTSGEPVELVAYESGDWYICRPRVQYQAVAVGKESDQATAQMVCVRVAVALTGEDIHTEERDPA